MEKQAMYVADPDDQICRVDFRGELEVRNMDREKCKKVLKIHIDSDGL